MKDTQNGAINIPLYELEICSDCRLKEKDRIIIVYCQSGIRSKKAIKILSKNGFKNLYHLKGGLDEIQNQCWRLEFGSLYLKKYQILSE